MHWKRTLPFEEFQQHFLQLLMARLKLPVSYPQQNFHSVRH